MFCFCQSEVGAANLSLKRLHCISVIVLVILLLVSFLEFKITLWTLRETPCLKHRFNGPRKESAESSYLDYELLQYHSQ